MGISNLIPQSSAWCRCPSFLVMFSGAHVLLTGERILLNDYKSMPAFSAHHRYDSFRDGSSTSRWKLLLGFPQETPIVSDRATGGGTHCLSKLPESLQQQHEVDSVFVIMCTIPATARGCSSRADCCNNPLNCMIYLA